MPTHFWATSNNNSGNSGYWPSGIGVKTDSIGMPTGRQALGGNWPIYIGGIHSYVASGVSGIYPVLYYQGAEFGGGRVFSGSGGTASFVIRATGGGTMYFGRQTGTGLSVVDERDGYVWGGSTLAGACDWAQVASAPQAFAVSVNGLTASFTATGTADEGGAAVSAYRREVSINGGGWGGANDNWSAPYAMTAGNTYRRRLYAVNLVGNSLATYTSTITATGGGKRWNGSEWVALTTGKRWNGSAWVDLTTRKRYNGSSWVDINN